MGASCIRCPITSKKKPKYSIEPEDTSEFHPEKLTYRLRKLDFKGLIDNVEIINYPYDIISINLVISDFFECSLPRQKRNTCEKTKENTNDLGHSNKIKWKMQTKFDLRMDEYELRKSFMTVSIFNDSPNALLQEKLNLFQIVTGPYHHDIALNFDNKVTSRLLFDLKISQKFIILINPIQVSVVLNQEYPGQEFNYSFNSYSCGQKISSSDGSIPQKVSIISKVQGKYRQLKPEDECESPTKIRKGTDLNKMIKNTMISSLNWLKPKEAVIKLFISEIQDELPDEASMPSFKFELISSQINKSYLQFILWYIEFNTSFVNSEAILFSDCYISFSRLFESDYVSVENLDDDQIGNEFNRKKILQRLQNRVCIIEEPLIKDGRSVGKLVVKLNVTNETFFSQLSFHARTEDGIVYMNSMFKNYIGKQEKVLQSDRIMKIQSCFQRIIDHFYKLYQLKSQKKRNWSEINRMEEKVLEDLNLLIQLLSISLDQSLIFGRKHNLDEIMEKQNLFLGILERLQIFLEEDTTNFVQEIWKITFLTLQRGQFYLENIGFGQFDPNNPVNSKMDKQNDSSEPSTSIIYPKKIKIALRYQEIIYKVLLSSLRYNYESQRHTIIEVQAIKAYSYFRIPNFRDQVLKCISRSEEELNFSDQTNEIFKKQTNKTVMISRYEEKAASHLDWERYFYLHLKNQRKSHDLNLLLDSNFKTNRWFQSITERKQNFYIFLQYFTKKMAQLGKRLKILQYSICPGYNKLVRTFLIQLKRKPILEYEACMIQTSTVLLVNYDLINIIIPIVVEKTNLFDTVSLNQFLNIFANYMKFLTQNGTKTLPQKFNTTYFFKIIKIILEADYCYAVSKILVILHTYFECFNDEFKDILCLYLLSKAFFRLFFHWSFGIRVIFYHLFIIKIYWSKLNGVTEKVNNMDTYQNENCQIYERYKKLIKILNAAERQKCIQKKSMKRAQKQEYYLKMKRKISKRLRRNQENGNKGQQKQQVDISSELSIPIEQEKLNLSKLHTLCELKDGYNRSETLCSSQIKEHLRKIQSQKSFSRTIFSEVKPKQNNKNPEEESESEVFDYGINLKINNKKRSSKNYKDNWSEKNGESEMSVKEEIQKLNEDYIKKLSLVSHKASSGKEKPLCYTFFGNNDYQLEEISFNEENKILLGMEEFRQTQEFVEKYILQKGLAPHVNLDPEVQLDSNQFKLIEITNL